MRVLQIVPWYEPAWSTGGTAIAVTMLCQSLAARGIDVTVYTTTDAGEGKHLNIPTDECVRLNGVNVWYFRCGLIGDFRAAFYSSGLSEKIKRTIKDFDLVHISTVRNWHATVAGKYAVSNNVPYVVSLHANLMHWGMKQIGYPSAKLLYHHLLDRNLLQNSDALHYLCEGEREESRIYDGNHTSFLVPNGIDIEKFGVHDRRRIHLREQRQLQNKFSLLFLGRIHPVKNLHLSIEAISRLENRNDLVFNVVGPIADKSYYRLLHCLVAEKGLTEQVHFFPAASHDAVVDWYQLSDLLMLPSEVEGLSMSQIEAAATGLPVLASDRVANRYEIKADNAGMIVSPTVDSIATALDVVIKKPLFLKTLAENAFQSACTRYDRYVIAAMMIKAYESILSGTREDTLQWG